MFWQTFHIQSVNSLNGPRPKLRAVELESNEAQKTNQSFTPSHSHSHSTPAYTHPSRASTAIPDTQIPIPVSLILIQIQIQIQIHTFTPEMRVQIGCGCGCVCVEQFESGNQKLTLNPSNEQATRTQDAGRTRSKGAGRDRIKRVWAIKSTPSMAQGRAKGRNEV